MLKKSIKYKLNGEETTEIHFFNLTKAEIIDLELGQDGTLSNIIKTLMETEDATKVLGIFKKIVMASYGKKSDDGRLFIKNEEATANFLSSEAYSEMFMEMLQDPKAASAFFEGLVPQDMIDEIKKTQASDKPEVKEDAVQQKVDADQEAFEQWQRDQEAKKAAMQNPEPPTQSPT